MDKDEISSFFSCYYAHLIQNGFSPNDAAAEIIPIVQKASSDQMIHFQVIQEVVRQSKESNSCTSLIKLVGKLFSNASCLNQSFLSADSDRESENLELDIDLIRRTFAVLLDLNVPAVTNALKNALESLIVQYHFGAENLKEPSSIRQFIVLLEYPLLIDPDYYRPLLSGICRAIHYLPPNSKKFIINHFSCRPKEDVVQLVGILQQFITVRIYMASGRLDDVFGAVSVLSLLNAINDVKGFLKYQEFYNDAVNSEINLTKDYAKSSIFRKRSGKQLSGGQSLEEGSFCDHPFILDPGSKARVLQIDSDYQQRTEVHDALVRSVLQGRTSPYVVLRIRREEIISDTLRSLALIPTEELKKPLKVQFIGEEGIDEGGVQKEFFQVMIRQLLDPAYGMFKYYEETHTLWFNSHSLESSMEFELIGVLLGLAIYNGVILDLHFPRVVYKKLMNFKPTLDDLKEAQPDLGKGLQQLLDFEGDTAQVFHRNFQISYELFDEIKTVDLCEDGGNRSVTNENRQEYVDLYVEYLLEKSVGVQYNAFHKGFHMVCGGDALQLFRWEELELLICGSPDLDFEGLEKVTHYEDGYTEDSACIRNFWSVVHELPIEEKRKLLMFCTGSDRVPIRGLSNMIFVISRNGPDSDRLPTAHTCFNHLLLPDYSSREKLKERLCLAINQAEGFGLM